MVCTVTIDEDGNQIETCECPKQEEEDDIVETQTKEEKQVAENTIQEVNFDSIDLSKYNVATKK